MEQIELVIKMPREDYALIMSGRFYLCGSRGNGKTITSNLMESICRGTLLPSGHGALVDKSKIYKAIYAEEDNCTGMGMTLDEMNAYNDGIDAMYFRVENAPTIIEADKEGVEE